LALPYSTFNSRIANEQLPPPPDYEEVPERENIYGTPFPSHWSRERRVAWNLQPADYDTSLDSARNYNPSPSFWSRYERPMLLVVAAVIVGMIVWGLA
jgi:hypothetical protein